ncbi:MAG: S9 family peptidase, partial [Planctomycetota bacterium]
HVAYGHTFFHEMQLLASRGYVVLMTNPRGSDGYGLAHRSAIHADWGNVDTKDLMTALNGLLREGYVDEERLFVTGGSYGGYMTNWLVGHTNRFRAAVTQRSVVNLTSFFGQSDFGFYFQWEFGGTPWESEDLYKKLSPLTYAKKTKTPLLIIHSENDQRAPMPQAEELFTTLKLMGKEVEFVRFVGEGHELSRSGRPQNRAERLRRILEWFRRHGGRP